MFLSREINIKLCQIYTKIHIDAILYKRCSIEQVIFDKYATNLKTTISHRSQRNSSQLQLLFEYNNFSFLRDIINNIIYAFGTCHQNFNQWQCRIIVTCLRLYHGTSILHCHWRKSWSRDTEEYLNFLRYGIILTQFYVNFSRQEHQIDAC